jgi:hypothetical protein
MWTWANGRLLGSPAPGGAPGFLVSEAEFEDFELKLEYRLGAGAGSGLFLRCVPTDEPTGAGQMELQMIDDDAYPRLPEANKTGSIYAVFSRKAIPTTRHGEWNTVRVRLVKRHIEVWINGTQTIDADLDTAGPKLATVPGLTRKKGGIGLQQNQKSDVEFRKIEIKELAPAKADAQAAPGAAPNATGFVSLFNGKELTGWYVENGDARQWVVEGDAIIGRSANFSTRNYYYSVTFLDFGSCDPE